MFKVKCLLLPVLFFLFIFGLGAQAESSGSVDFSVRKVSPFLSVSPAQVQSLQQIDDIRNALTGENLEYKKSWVKEFISVDISTYHQGETRTASASDNQLNAIQKQNIRTADSGSPIKVKVKYLPNNELRSNEIKELNFDFVKEPQSEARFPGGQTALEDYLLQNAILKIPPGTYQNYEVSAVKFTVTKEGEIVHPSIVGEEYELKRKKEIEALLQSAVSNMPCWEPAVYADGEKAPQEFILTVGNHENCIVHLLHSSY